MRFEPTFDSLRTYRCPEWFRNAKFGIWSHWGPQSVPMYGDWYARHMYIEGSPQYLYHLRHYGHPSVFGYKDLVKLWKAERFDPEALMDRYKKAGARYFVAQAMHHDNFFNFPSKYNRYNAAEMGPEKDICGLWKQAADNQGLPFGLTEHHSASFSWWTTNKAHDEYGPYAGVPYDGNDPEHRAFYHDNFRHYDEVKATPGARARWFTDDARFHEHWLAVMKELIDLYKPDLLYSDGPLPFGERMQSPDSDPLFAPGLEAVAYLYNTSIALHGENRAVYNQKDVRPEIYSVGILDIEKSQMPGIQAEPWQTDTCIGNWFYDVRQSFKRPKHIIEMLVDIISKNGVMLLNILQLPHGGIDRETEYILDELEAWFAVCAEGVHDTRPWRSFGEGDSQVVIDGFREEEVRWNASDYRFTCKGNTLYAFMMAPPDNRVAVVKSLLPQEKVLSVRLLGGERLEFSQAFGTLTVQLPEKLPTPYANCMAIELA